MRTQILDTHGSDEKGDTNDIVEIDVPDEAETLLEVDDLIDMQKFAEIFAYAD